MEAPAVAAVPTLGSLVTGAEPAAPPVTPEPSGADAGGEDPVTEARRKAREVLFSDKEPEEATGGEEEKPAAEAKPEEKKPEEAKPEDKDEIALSKKWAKFHAQEKRLVERQKKFAEEQRSLETTRTEIESLRSKLAEREAQMNDPVAFLASAGWTKDQIVQWIQSDGKVEPEILIKQLSEKHQKEMEELRAEREREREELKRERTKRELDRVGAELDSEVSTMLKGDPEFGLLQKFVAKKGEAGVQKRVKDIIAKVWGEKQQVVDPRDVLVYLERELAEIQLSDPSPGQAPAVKTANPVAVEPKPITNQATSQRTVVPQEEEDTLEGWRARSRAILRGEIPVDE